tara:strand:+ start:1427 stop:1969 length:543 start_codon:yes stop_codon:yes gene_type:complete
MPVSINGNTGVVTGIAVGGLPDGIVDTDMLAANAVTAAKRGAGAILQYVEAPQSVMTPRFSTTSTSYTATGYKVDITPIKSNSRIIVIASLSCAVSGGSGAYHFFRCAEDGTVSDMYEAGQGTTGWFQTYCKYIFTPGDTNAHEYKIYAKTGSNTLLVGWSADGGSTRNWNSMCAMEVAG